MNIVSFLKKSKSFFDLLIIMVGAIITFLLAKKYDILENVVRFAHRYEQWELDELIITFIFLVIALAVFSVRRWREIVRAKRVAEELNVKLQATLAEVKVLKGILPICANCKKVRDDRGYWQQVESYISEHSDTIFSHSICPDCMEALYPEYAHEITGENQQVGQKNLE